MSEESYKLKYDKLRGRVKELRSDLLEQEGEIERLNTEIERLRLVMYGCSNCFEHVTGTFNEPPKADLEDLAQFGKEMDKSSSDLEGSN